MLDTNKTKEQLIDELAGLRQRISKLDKSEVEHKRAEAALKHSEERYRELVEKAEIAILIDDKEGNIQYFNKKLAELFGCSMEEMKNQSIESIVHPDDIDRVMEFHKKRTQGRKIPSRYKFKGIKKDGSSLYLEVNAVKLKDKNNIIGTRSYMWDITERRQADKALRKSEERYRSLLNSISDSVYVLDREWRHIVINDAATDFVKMPKEKLLGSKLTDLFPGVEKTAFYKTFKRVMETRKSDTVADEFTFEDGRKDWYEVNVYSVKEGILCISRNITGRKKDEEALRESEEKFRTLAEQSPNMIFINKKGRVVYANKKCTEITGYKRDELYSPDFDFWRLIAPESLEKEKTTDAKHMKGEEVKPYEFAIISKNGKRIDLIHTTKLISYEGEMAILAIETDITERKRSEDRLKSSEALNFALFQYNPIETIAVDREGRIIKTNMARRKSGDRWPNIGDVMYRDYAGKHEIDMHTELMECIRSGKKKEFPEMKYGDKFLSITIGPFPEGAIITSQDITERKKAEEALRESDERFRMMLRNTAITIFSQDKDLRYTWAYSLSPGFDEDAILGKTDADLVTPENAKKPMTIKRQVLQTGQGTRAEASYIKDGEKQFYDLMVEPLVDTTGEIVGVICLSIDITERKKAEERLQESEEQFRVSVETLLDGFGIFSTIRDKKGHIADFRYEYINEAGCQLNKMTREEQIGHTLLELLPMRKDTGLFDEYARLVETGKPIVKESLVYEDVFGVGQKLSRAFDVRAVKLGDGFAVTWRDVTGRKKAEGEIKNSREQLRNLAAHLQAVREQERTLIAREMHDELGQSLTALKMDIALLSPKLPKEQKFLLDKTKSMSKLVDTTLQTVKRISTELRPGLLDDLGLAAAIEWQGEEFQNRTGIKCEMTIIPSDIILDPDRSTAIFRIFQETLTNVARHARATKIKVTLRKKARKIELRVKDNGKGITEKQMADSKSFGLIGIRERVQFFGGAVEIKGIPDKGTTVIATIPLSGEGEAQ